MGVVDGCCEWVAHLFRGGGLEWVPGFASPKAEAMGHLTHQLRYVVLRVVRTRGLMGATDPA